MYQMFSVQHLLERGGGAHDVNDLSAPSSYTMHRTARYYQVRIRQMTFHFLDTNLLVRSFRIERIYPGGLVILTLFITIYQGQRKGQTYVRTSTCWALGLIPDRFQA
mgnify:CR=1 FL=1